MSTSASVCCVHFAVCFYSLWKSIPPWCGAWCHQALCCYALSSISLQALIWGFDFSILRDTSLSLLAHRFLLHLAPKLMLLFFSSHLFFVQFEIEQLKTLLFVWWITESVIQQQKPSLHFFSEHTFIIKFKIRSDVNFDVNLVDYTKVVNRCLFVKSHLEGSDWWSRDILKFTTLKQTVTL